MSTWLALLAGCFAEADRVMVVVAARDLAVGVPIVEGDVYAFAMEAQYVPEHSFVAAADVIGRVPSTRILANEPISGRRLADAELQRMLEAMVPPGLEVMTVPLDPRADRPPIPREETVDVLLGSRVVAIGVAVLRVDGVKVAVMADEGQVRAIARAQFEGEPTVVVSRPTPP